MVIPLYISEVLDSFPCDCFLLFLIWKSFLWLCERRLQCAIISDVLNDFSSFSNRLYSFKSLCLGRWKPLCLKQLCYQFALWKTSLNFSRDFTLSDGLDCACRVVPWHSVALLAHCPHIVPPSGWGGGWWYLARCLAHRTTSNRGLLRE